MNHMLINGKSGCGKTHFLLNYLEKSKIKIDEKIYIVCPTFSINITWQKWKYKHDLGVVILESHDVDRSIKEILRLHKENNDDHTLIILDDVVSTKDVKSKSGELVKLGFSGRHLGIDTIVLTQQLTSIAKTYQENVSFLVTFYTPGKCDMKLIVEEYLDSEAKPDKI